MDRRRVAISLLIAALLLLQAIPALRVRTHLRHVPGASRVQVALSRLTRAPLLYPFVDYPMYSETHFPGDVVHRYKVYGVRPDGGLVELEPAALEMTPFPLRRAVEQQLAGADEELLGLAQVHARALGKAFTSLRIVDDPVALEAYGIRHAPRAVVAVVPLPAAGGS